MKFGHLADLFDGAGAKALSAVEVDPARSNQHEFQGVATFRTFLGRPADKIVYRATFLWLTDDEEVPPASVASFCTWSNVRRNRPDRAAEYHLYYGAESAALVHRARPGDLLIVAKTTDGTLLVLMAPAGSTIAGQLLWLFGLDLLAGTTSAREIGRDDSVSLGLAARSVLDSLGITVEEPQPDAFGLLLDRFGPVFPGTAVFSAFARDTLQGIDPLGDPDGALIAWMEHEEALFRHLERQIVAERLISGFTDDGVADVDGFVSFSLSVQNRRKSRAGYAFAHHVEVVLKAHHLSYSREARTEKRNAADFLFPGEAVYPDLSFPAERLTMLAVKTTCKDRWRQVLAEADRVVQKHLLTLEPAISRPQTDEMQKQNLQLVLPAALHASFQKDQQPHLLDMAGFLTLVRARAAA